MSQAGDERPIELTMLAPYSAPGVVELLYAAAHFHRSGGGLSRGDTINFGRPWIGDSPCSHGLVSTPYVDGPVLGEALIDGQPVQVLWLLPVTPGEVAFLKQNGLAALEAAFDEAQLQFARPGRASVV
jgi:hypothetical protein